MSVASLDIDFVQIWVDSRTAQQGDDIFVLENGAPCLGRHQSSGIGHLSTNRLSVPSLLAGRLHSGHKMHNLELWLGPSCQRVTYFLGQLSKGERKSKAVKNGAVSGCPLVARCCITHTAQEKHLRLVLPESLPWSRSRGENRRGWGGERVSPP